MPCVHHCQSILVNSLPAPPLTIYTLDSHKHCVLRREWRVEGGEGGGRRGGAEEEVWRREEERGREGEKRKWSKIIIPYEQPHTCNT